MHQYPRNPAFPYNSRTCWLSGTDKNAILKIRSVLYLVSHIFLLLLPTFRDRIFIVFAPKYRYQVIYEDITAKKELRSSRFIKIYLLLHSSFLKTIIYCFMSAALRGSFWVYSDVCFLDSSSRISNNRWKSIGLEM